MATDPDPAGSADLQSTIVDDGRNETENQRLDRNWVEILQELRVTQTGTQILTGFLLTIAFQPRFRDLDHYQLVVYLILVSAAVLVTALGLAPVNLHRALFRKQVKATVVYFGHRVLRVMFFGVGSILVGTLWLIFDVTLGHASGIIAAIGMVLFLLAIYLVPRWARRVD